MTSSRIDTQAQISDNQFEREKPLAATLYSITITLSRNFSEVSSFPISNQARLFLFPEICQWWHKTHNIHKFQISNQEEKTAIAPLPK